MVQILRNKKKGQFDIHAAVKCNFRTVIWKRKSRRTHVDNLHKAPEEHTSVMNFGNQNTCYC
jgi:hypothetical protein